MKKICILLLLGIIPALLPAMNAYDDFSFPDDVQLNNAAIASLEELANEKTEPPIEAVRATKRQRIAGFYNQAAITNAPVQSTQGAMKELYTVLHKETPYVSPPSNVGLQDLAPSNSSQIMRCPFCSYKCMDFLRYETHYVVYHEPEYEMMQAAALQAAQPVKFFLPISPPIVAPSMPPLLKSAPIVSTSASEAVAEPCNKRKNSEEKPFLFLVESIYITPKEEELARAKEKDYENFATNLGCVICSTPFGSRAKLKAHCGELHSRLRIPGTSPTSCMWWECPHCAEKVQFPWHLMWHIRLRHTAQNIQGQEK